MKFRSMDFEFLMNTGRVRGSFIYPLLITCMSSILLNQDAKAEYISPPNREARVPSLAISLKSSFQEQASQGREAEWVWYPLTWRPAVVFDNQQSL